LGKFFGLAGARVGFVLAARPLLNTLAEALGPWTIAGPCRAIARGALLDRAWQEATRQRLRQDSRRLAELLTRGGLAPHGGCELFQWVRTDRALEIHEHLASKGILTRHFGSVPSLRFGLPEDWGRLEEVLV
jgi:cobalamin biosynthetic protein CobC